MLWFSSKAHGKSNNIQRLEEQQEQQHQQQQQVQQHQQQQQVQHRCSVSSESKSKSIKATPSMPLHGSASTLTVSPITHNDQDWPPVQNVDFTRVDDSTSKSSDSITSTVSLLAFADPNRRLAAISAESKTGHAEVSTSCLSEI